MKSLRFWTVVLLLTATAVVLHSRGDKDYIPPREPLSNMPQTIGGWTSHDIPMDAETLAVLGEGDFLNRSYFGTTTLAHPVSAQVGAVSNPLAPVGLFIGYFPTQRTGQTIHSPQHCLPGAGWTFESSQYTNLRDIKGNNYQVGEYVINNGESKQFVIYWYQAHGRSIANEYKARLRMVTDAIRTNRTDGALVRVITPISTSEPVSSARERAVLFASQMAPYLPQFIPN
ncbi:MAG TPA: EpsI family protein [Edaphobacter sp.]|jgi:EpsI family protein|nr:EpsI family protein [Edaphobacter sp.]